MAQQVVVLDLEVLEMALFLLVAVAPAQAIVGAMEMMEVMALMALMAITALSLFKTTFYLVMDKMALKVSMVVVVVAVVVVVHKEKT